MRSISVPSWIDLIWAATLRIHACRSAIQALGNCKSARQCAGFATTRSPRPVLQRPLNSVPTSSCIRPPSISAATATCSRGALVVRAGWRMASACGASPACHRSHAGPVKRLADLAWLSLIAGAHGHALANARDSHGFLACIAPSSASIIRLAIHPDMRLRRAR